MINLRSIRKLFFVLLYAFPIVLLGEPESQHHPSSHKDNKPLLNRIDQNKDGIVSMVEFAKAPKLDGLPEDKISKMFRYLDKNSDGTLSSEELPRHPKHHTHRRPFREHLHKADSDKDGKISREEFLMNPPPHLKSSDKGKAESIFSLMDINNDGYLSPEDGSRHDRKPRELKPHFREHFEKLDLDGDKQLSFEEFIQGERAQNLSKNEQMERFKRLDENQDGAISREDRESRIPRGDQRPGSKK